MSMYRCPYTDCPFGADDSDDVDDHVVAAHMHSNDRYRGDE